MNAALAAAAAVLAALGSWLIYTAVTSGTRPAAGTRVPIGRRVAEVAYTRLAGADPSTRPSEVLAATAAGVLAGGVAAYALFGAPLPAALGGLLAGGFPGAAFRARARTRRETAAAEWPRLLEEIRLRTGSLGRSIPQALFEAGRSAPPEWRAAFVAAEREWLLTVDLGRTLALLKEGLADPTADAVCETLLVAHEIGGSDLDRKLADLIEDRVIDVQARKDAASRLAGVRFARRFVLLVPAGMAVAGLTIGTGRHAYATAGGQAAVVVSLVAIAACWWWSGRLMRLPQPPRVFR